MSNTLRDEFHEIGNKLNKFRIAAGFIKAFVADLTIKEEEKAAADKIISACNTLEGGVVEIDHKINGLKSIVYRKINPDETLEDIYGEIKETNQNLNMFILDDDVALCEMLKDIYEKKGMSVVFASSGEKALELLTEFKPHIAMLDLHLGGDLTGLDILTFIKREIPMCINLVITKEDDKEVLNKIREKEVFGILIKPVTLQELDTKINGMIHLTKKD